MPSLTRALLVAVHATAFVLSVVSPWVSPALASPVPAPLPLVASFADYVQRSDLVARLQDLTIPVHDYTVSTTKIASSTEERRQTDDTSILNNLNALNSYYTQINNNAGTMGNLASQASTQGDNADYQQQCLTTLSAFHTNLLGFQTAFAELAADKGLANYDKNDQLETLLKDVINLCKNILSYTDELVYQIPALGPILGPIVYDVKCILDDVLDAVENLVDAILNAIEPLLQSLIGQATQTACDSGIQIAGLCIAVR